MTRNMWPLIAAVLFLAVVSVGGSAAFLYHYNDATTQVQRLARDADAQNDDVEGAIQQQVAATWAVRDAMYVQVVQNGTKNGLLAVIAQLLFANCVATLAVVEVLRRRKPPTPRTEPTEVVIAGARRPLRVVAVEPRPRPEPPRPG